MVVAWGIVTEKLPDRNEAWSDGKNPAEHKPAVCLGDQEGQQHLACMDIV